MSLKGIAIVFVLFTHISHSSYRVSALPGALGVCMFLILSGFGLHRSYRSHELDGFLSKRSKTVLVPYWLAVLALTAIREESIELMELILLGSLAFFPQGVHGWFLQMIVPLYIIFYVSFRLFKTPWKQSLALFLASSALWFLPNAMPSLKNQQIYSLFVGTMLSMHRESLQSTIRRWGATRIVAGLLFISVPIYVLAQFARQTDLMHLIMPLFMNVALVGFSLLLIVAVARVGDRGFMRPAHRSGVSRVLSTLALCGAISYEIYICHGPLEWIVRDEHFYSSRVLFLALAICTAFLLFAAKRMLFRAMLWVTFPSKWRWKESRDAEVVADIET